MDFNTILGIVIIASSLGLICYLTFWGRRTIERISRKNLSSARQILQDLKDD